MWGMEWLALKAEVLLYTSLKLPLTRILSEKNHLPLAHLYKNLRLLQKIELPSAADNHPPCLKHTALSPVSFHPNQDIFTLENPIHI